MAEIIREIVLDTETTGLSPEEGHRIIEIGAFELINHMPTGKQLHLYIQPEREIDEAAEKVHGISSAFLADKPVFADIVEEFLAFIQDDVMVIHNAAFDMGFINAELKRAGYAPLEVSVHFDTLAFARRKFPGAQASLDALCRRFQIDNTHRDLHGALIDADLLAEVYIELLGGRQPDLGLASHSVMTEQHAASLRRALIFQQAQCAPYVLMKQAPKSLQNMNRFCHKLKIRFGIVHHNKGMMIAFICLIVLWLVQLQGVVVLVNDDKRPQNQQVANSMA